MIYDNSEVRRRDRLLEEEAARHLLEQGEYGILSLVDEYGEAYGVCTNYVWDGDHSLYTHCAPEGRKLRCIDAHPQVSFTVIGHTQVVPEHFTTEYQSIVLCGTARRALSDDEKKKGLMLIVKKFAPAYEERFHAALDRSFHRVEMIRIDVDRWSGKTKKMKLQPEGHIF